MNSGKLKIAEMETVEIKECLYYINHKKSLTLLDLKCGHKPESDHPYFGHQKNYKVLMKIDKISDVFTNPANFSRYTFFTLAPPSSNTMKQNTTIKVSKVG